MDWETECMLKDKRESLKTKINLISRLVVLVIATGSLGLFDPMAWGQGQPGLNSPNSRGNKAYLMDDEKEIATARWDLINMEPREIFQVYLEWDTQKLGYANFAALYNSGKTKKIKGRVMIDGWGVNNLPNLNIADSFNLATLKALKNKGVEVRFYNPVSRYTDLLNPGSSMGRMHFKVTWLKSLNIIETGDLNNLNINFRADNRPGKKGLGYRSTETMVQGPISLDVAEFAESIWSHGTVPDLSSVTDEELRQAERNLERYFGAATAIREKAPSIDWFSKLEEVDSIKFIHDDLNNKGKVFPLDDEFVKIIDGTEVIDGPLTLVSPYIDLPKPLFKSVKKARKRGVPVNVITTSMDSSDMKMASYVFIPQAEKLQALGVKVYVHEDMDLLHVKLIKRGNVVLLSSHNFNRRSKMTDIEAGFEYGDKNYASKVDTLINKLITEESKPFDPSKLSLATMCNVRIWQALTKIPFIGNQL